MGRKLPLLNFRELYTGHCARGLYTFRKGPGNDTKKLTKNFYGYTLKIQIFTFYPMN